VASELLFERDGVRLAGVDFGGDGPPALLLHGLAGYAGEWAETAGWLSERARVVALDARGQGSSERFPADVSRAGHVADAAFAVERLGLGPVVVVGQSLGGLTALLLAAERPRFDVEVVMRTLHEADSRSYWEEWERISCPALVGRGGDGSLRLADAGAMVARGRDAKLVERELHAGAGQSAQRHQRFEARDAASGNHDTSGHGAL
jgi:pimeloyl-ACP methyl ester carboxylesterase